MAGMRLPFAVRRRPPESARPGNAAGPDRGGPRRRWVGTVGGTRCASGLMRAGRALLAVAALTLLLSACARTVAVSPPQTLAVGAEETGLASWYGHPYHGRRTASGEVYDMNELTAAHRALPLGTRLMVTNLDNARAVDVRVNDRGPFVDGRILDLSYGAARVLGADRSGVIPVRLRVISLPLPRPPVAAAAPSGLTFAVQVGAFTSRVRAEGLRDAVGREGETAVISEAEVRGEMFYRVRVGDYREREEARAAAERLASRGY